MHGPRNKAKNYRTKLKILLIIDTKDIMDAQAAETMRIDETLGEKQYSCAKRALFVPTIGPPNYF